MRPDERHAATRLETTIRPAEPADVPVILGLIRDLAAYEREPDAVETTEADLHAALFGTSPAAYCHLALVEGEVAGFALWFLSFSTWRGRHGVYLEDLYVAPAWRGRGVGRALLQQLASICVQGGYARLEWSVLDWNADAHAFYRTLGAEPMSEWTVWRLTGDALTQLGSR